MQCKYRGFKGYFLHVFIGRIDLLFNLALMPKPWGQFLPVGIPPSPFRRRRRRQVDKAGLVGSVWDWAQPGSKGVQAVGAAEGPGEGTTLQPRGAHSVGLLWWEPSRQPGGCSRLGALPDPRDVQPSGRENSVEKAKVALDLVLIICF